MGKITIPNRIKDRLVDMKLGDTIDKSEFIKEIYGMDDYYYRRSFDVALCDAKKLIKEEFPFREFKSNKNNLIERIY